MQAGAELARHLAVHCPAPQLATIGPPLLSGLVKVLRHESLPNGLRPEQPEAVSMRAFSYGAVATLCARAPALLRSDLALVAMLFRALPSEDAGARTALQEALAALAAVHAPAAAAAAAAPTAVAASAPCAAAPELVAGSVGATAELMEMR